MSEPLILDEFDARDLAHMRPGESDGKHTVVENTIIGHSRWSIDYELVVERESDKTYWSAVYGVGATEMQEERPFEDEGDVTFGQVFPVQVSVTKYLTQSEIDKSGASVDSAVL